MWGGQFHYNEQGEVNLVKQIITHPEKIRYLLQLTRGLGVEGSNGSADVYRNGSEEEWHIPLSQIIYVGDGANDMPAFFLINERRGRAIDVFNPDGDLAEEWSGYEDMSTRRQVQNLARADYSQDSELMQSLLPAVESICQEMALRRLSIGE